MRREINLSFFGHQVDVREHNDADHGLLGNLRAPTRFSAGVITLAFLEPEFQQEFDEIDEMFARAAESVMIVVAPAETELILSAFLDLSGAIAAFPISALGCEEEFAREIAADKLEAVVEDFVRDAETAGVIGEKARACLPKFFGLDDGAELIEIERGRDKAPVGMSLYGFELGAVLFGDNDSAITGERFAFNLGGKIVSGNEIGHKFRAESDDGGILFFAGTKHYTRKSCARIFIYRFAIGTFSFVVQDETGFEQSILFGRRDDEMVNPFEEIRAGFVAHAVGEPASEPVFAQESGDVTAQESLGVVGEGPVELRCAHGSLSH